MRRATAVLVLAVMLAIGGPAVSGAAAHESHSRYWKVRVPPGLAVYEWHNAGDLAPAEVQRRLRFLRANGFRTIYLEVGKYLDAADASDRELLRAIRSQIRRFVATATGYGLSVQALGGGPNWFGPDFGYLGPMLVNLVASYNTGVDKRERLAGVHLDLEPYTQDGWLAPANVRDNVGLYLDTIAEIVGAYRAALGTWGNRNLQLGLAIPFWFDGSSEDIPDDIEFGDGGPQPPAFHVIDLVHDLPGAYLVVMAYAGSPAPRTGRSPSPATSSATRPRSGPGRGWSSASSTAGRATRRRRRPPSTAGPAGCSGGPRPRSRSPSAATRSFGGCRSTTSTPS